MRELHGIDISREAPYRYLSMAAGHGMLRFVPRTQDVLTKRLVDIFPWLRADVVHCGSVESVADRAAEKLVELLIERHRRLGKDEISIGWSGGHSMWLLAKKLALLLSQEREGLPRKIVCHSLTAGFDLKSVGTDPGGFLAWLVDNPTVRIQTGFVGLRAPAIVKIRQRREMLSLPGIADAAELARSLDIIVTSCGVLEDEHSMLHMYYDHHSPETARFLEKSGCVGDILWMPLRETEPIRLDEIKPQDQDRLYCAMTLLDPDSLHTLVEGGTDVMLVAGPCTHCYSDKSRVVRAILRQSKRLVTHLVADHRTVRGVLEAEAKAISGIR
jgi:hypothetical protein